MRSTEVSHLVEQNTKGDIFFGWCDKNILVLPRTSAIMQTPKDNKYQKALESGKKAIIYLIIYYLFIYSLLVFFFKWPLASPQPVRKFMCSAIHESFTKKGEP